MDLRSLQNGPKVVVRHDEENTGNFSYLAGPLPIQMLMYFSSTLHGQLDQRNNSSPCPYVQLMGTATSPSVKIRGSDPTALKDLFIWMQACASNGTIQSLSNVVNNDPVRHVLALSCAHALGVRALNDEISMITKRLEQYTLTCDQVTQLMATQSLLPELRQPIVDHVARQFCLGALLDPNGFVMLGRLNPGFDKEVALKLKDLREKKWNIKAEFAEGIWLRKSFDDYRNKLVSNINQGQPCAPAPKPAHKPSQPVKAAAIAKPQPMPLRQPSKKPAAPQPPVMVSHGTQTSQAFPQPPQKPQIHVPMPSAYPQPSAMPFATMQSHPAYLPDQPSVEEYYRAQHPVQSPYMHAAQILYPHAPMPGVHPATYQPQTYLPVQTPMVPQVYPVYDQMPGYCHQPQGPQYQVPPVSTAPLDYTSTESSTSRRARSPPRRKEIDHRRYYSSTRNDRHVQFAAEPQLESSDDQNQRHRRRRSSSHRQDNARSIQAASPRATGSRDPSPESILRGEELKSIHDIGNDRYRYVFEDKYGSERWVEKGPGFRKEGSRRRSTKSAAGKHPA